MTSKATMSPADALRAWVVKAVLLGILGLSFLLYVAIIAILLRERTAEAVPDALWLAAGAQAGILGALLVNSKGGAEGGQVGGSVPVQSEPQASWVQDGEGGS